MAINKVFFLVECQTVAEIYVALPMKFMCNFSVKAVEGEVLINLIFFYVN